MRCLRCPNPTGNKDQMWEILWGRRNTATNSATAFAASLKLDSSHRGLAVPGRSPANTHSPATPIPCGSGLARESGGSANTSTNSAAAFAASLKLDSSHKGLAVPGRSPAEHSLPINTNHLWERACPRKRWFSQHFYQPCHRLRSLAKARQLPQGTSRAWAISSRALTARQHQSPVGAGLPAKAVVQPTPPPTVPPPSQPR